MGKLSNRLPALAAEIREQHAKCERAAKASIEHAIECGKLLLEAKGQLKHGEWMPWLEEHCQLSGRTARRYMRVAKNAENGHVANLSIRAADKLLANIGCLDIDLSKGLLGKCDGVVIQIHPVGRTKYTGWSYIDLDLGEHSVRSRKGIHESEIVAWLSKHGIDADDVEWLFSLGEQPRSDTRMQKYVESEIA